MKSYFMKKIFFLLLLVFCLITIQNFAQDSKLPPKTKFLIEAGIEYGGDEILQVFFTNGEDQTMRAGQGGFISFGGQFEFKNVKQFMIRTSIGIKYNTTAADNANIRLTRFPINLTPFWKITDDVRLGVGVSTHLGAKLNGDGFIPDVKFTSEAGPRFEFGYKWFALTYTAINYKDDFNKSFSASSFGASVSFTIPK